MIEIEVTILSQYVSILIDRGASLSYISPQNVERCNVQSEKFKST